MTTTKKRQEREDATNLTAFEIIAREGRLRAERTARLRALRLQSEATAVPEKPSRTRRPSKT